MVYITDHSEPNHFKSTSSSKANEIASGGPKIYGDQGLQGSCDVCNDVNVGDNFCTDADPKDEVLFNILVKNI